MTAPAPVVTDDAYTFRPPGRPVLKFAAALTIAAAILVLTWWAGLLAPRVDIVGYDISHDPRGHINGFDLDVVNSGPLGVEIVGAGFSDAPTQAVEKTSLGPNGTRVVHLAVVEGPCSGRLRVDVRSPMGRVRSIDTQNSRLVGWCPAMRG